LSEIFAGGDPQTLAQIDPYILKTYIQTHTDENGDTIKTINNKKTVEYLNQYLMILNNSKPPQLIEIDDRQDNGL
jgi:hypothetical protein